MGVQGTQEITVYGSGLVRLLEDDAEYTPFVVSSTCLASMRKLEQDVHSSGFICTPGGGGGGFGGCDRNDIFRIVNAGVLSKDVICEVFELGCAECNVTVTSESTSPEETSDAVSSSSGCCVSE